MTYRSITLSLNDFRATGYDVDDLRTAPLDASWDAPTPGRVYLDNFYIERRANGGWFVPLVDDGHESDDLAELEVMLYEFAVGEELIKRPTV